MTHARKTGGPRPTTLRLVPSAGTGSPRAARSEPSAYDSILDRLSAIDPAAEVPTAPSQPEVPSAPDGPSIPEPSIPQPAEPATPAQPEEPIQPIDPTPDEETPDPEPAEVPS